MNDVPIPKLAGVCGWPVHHSLSPVLHGHWLRESGIRGAYIPFMVKPWEARDAFVSLKRTNIAGVNVTLPLKGDAFLAADERTEAAQRIGAANCLYKSGRKLIAHNTDLDGFAAPLLEARSRQELSQLSALVIGAGGAAKAVVGALVGLGVPEIMLSNRTDARADALVAEAGLPNFHAVPWSERQRVVRRAGLIINASAAGMSGFDPLDLKLGEAPPFALAYDLVYTPEITPFIADAREVKLDTIGGLAMLIGQARPSFELFYGRSAPEGDPSDILRRALHTGRR